MTREEAKAYKWFMLDVSDNDIISLYEAHIDKIYDDFESRTCENCKWYGTNFGDCELSGDLIQSPVVMKCNSHERKTDVNV